MDIRLNYEDVGSGAPLVLLHGNGESHEIFSAQIDFFSKKRRVIAVDTRGHGGSPRGKAPFTIPQFAKDLSCFFDELSLERADVLGFSDGGNIALEFALRFPERVRRLVLNGANLRPSGVRAKYQLPITLSYLKSRADGKDGRRELLELMVKWPKTRLAELSDIRVPTLVIAGTDDMIREGHTRMIAGAIKGSRLVFINGTHFIAQDNPDEFNAAVDDFFAETEQLK